MLKGLVAIGFLGLFSIWVLINELKIRKWMKAFDLHCEMYDKYTELINNPLTTHNELKEWLPKFDEVDEICARDCPDMKFFSIAHKVRKIIYEEELSREELSLD